MPNRTVAAVFTFMLALPALAHATAIEWDAPISWVKWDDAIARASAQNKPICLVVYADWCPKCRKLAPFFKRDDLLAASGKMVMVLQNHDERPEWLDQTFGEFGNYVPRIFFLDKQGHVDRTITSGHPRFPYFYRPNDEGVSQLLQSMGTAARKVGGPAATAAPQPAAGVPSPSGAANNTAPSNSAGHTGSAANAVASSNAVAAQAGTAGAQAQTAGGGLADDLPILLVLVVVAIGGVWFVGRNSGKENA